MSQKVYIRKSGKDLYPRMTKSKARLKYEHKCEHCSKEFISNRITAKYCSDNCRVYAFNKRKQNKEKMNAFRRIKRHNKK